VSQCPAQSADLALADLLAYVDAEASIALEDSAKGLVDPRLISK